MRRVWTVLTLVACSRTNEAMKAAPDASPPDSATAIVDAGPPKAALAEGLHDYRGTLGKATSVSMHLVKSGLKITGAYAYAQFGKPIQLAGKVEEDGSFTLAEFADRKVTGHLALHLEGPKLVGTWSDFARKKTLPLTLEPSAANAALYIDAGVAPGLAERGDQCLEDITCSADEAERLFLAADDEHAVDCARFIDGVGVKQDLVRGRACFEHEAKHLVCDKGSSPFLSTAELAWLRIDGLGGARDIAGARKLLAPCFADVTVETLLERAAKVEGDSKTPPLRSYCKEITGATTLVSNECSGRESRRDRDRANLLAKNMVKGFDDKGKTLFLEATKAFRAYLDAEESEAIASMEGGSLRYIYANNASAALQAERTKDLAAFGTFAAPTVSAVDVQQAKDENQAEFTKRITPAKPAERDKDAEPYDDGGFEKRLLEATKETQKVWLKYRDAEVAFYTHVHGKAQGAEHVRDAVTVMLTTRRTKHVMPEL